MTKAVRVHKVGGPEALVYEAVDVPPPAAGEDGAEVVLAVLQPGPGFHRPAARPVAAQPEIVVGAPEAVGEHAFLQIILAGAPKIILRCSDELALGVFGAAVGRHHRSQQPDHAGQ